MNPYGNEKCQVLEMADISAGLKASTAIGLGLPSQRQEKVEVLMLMANYRRPLG